MANYLTQEDVQNYGSDLVDFAQRAAAHAVAPHLQNLEQQNAELQRRLAKEARAPALQRRSSGDTVETKRAAQRNFRQSACDHSTILAWARFQTPSHP